MNAPPPDAAGFEAHARSLEQLYGSAAVNRLVDSRLGIADEGTAAIDFTIDTAWYHAAGAAHGSLYFKMLDDAAFFAANSLVTDRFLLTTSFNLHFTRPMKAGAARAHGRWVSGRRRVLVAEAHIVDSEGEVCARGTGTFMRSHIALSELDGYRVVRGENDE